MLFASNVLDELMIWYALTMNTLMIGVFYTRIHDRGDAEQWIGLFSLILSSSLVYFIWKFVVENKPPWMTIYLAILLFFELIELLLDYLLQLDFRSNNKIVIPYVVLFYISYWGLIAIAFTINIVGGGMVFILYAIHTILAIIARRQGKE